MSKNTRIIEIECCGECPNLDNRWIEPPWCCREEPFLEITKKHITKGVHKDCPLAKKSEYLEDNK